MIIERIWIDVLGYIALAFALFSFLCKDPVKTKKTFAISQFVMSVNYGLLAAWTSSCLQAILMFRSLASSLVKTMYQRHVVFVISSIALVLFTIITWSGPKSLFPLIGSMWATIALCYCNNKWMRILLIFGSISWFINAYVWESVPLMLAEIVKTSFNAWTLRELIKEEGQGEATSFEKSEARTMH